MGDVAKAIDQVILGRGLPSAEFGVAATDLIKRALLDLRAESKSGRYSFGGPSDVDVAVAVAIHGKIDALWPDIAEALVDKDLSRTDTAPALDRIAREFERVPAEVSDTLGRHSQDLISAPDRFFGSDVKPFPSALRALACTRALGSTQVLLLLSELAASPETLGRAEAAKSLTQFIRADLDYTWVEGILMQLSFDEEVGVRSEAGRGLALLARHVRSNEHLYSRMAVMLSESGLLTPLMILHGLRESEAKVQNKVLAVKLRGLAEDHPSPQVREAAQALTR